MGNWQKAKIHLALDRHQSQPTFPVVPVLLPGNDDPPTGFLALNTWIDLRANPQDPRALANLLAALQGKPPAEADFDPRTEVCPYRGLLPFREEDQPFFFGREADVAKLIEKVRQKAQPVVPIIGQSGSGKSSLVYAGLSPELRNPRQGTPWEIVTLRPRNEPLQELMAALSPPPEDAPLAQRIASLNQSTDLLREGKLQLSQLVTEILRQNAGSERLLLFVDQWEELYSQIPRDAKPEKKKRHEADRRLFVDALLEACDKAPCTLVFTVRADFYDQILNHAALTHYVEHHGLSLGPMTDAGLRACVEKPAEAAGYQFAEGLVDRILTDASEEPGRLPLLEYLLQELWKNREGNQFTHAGFEQAGGVAGAIATRAEAEFQKIAEKGDPKLTEAARRVFVSLVTPGEGREDTRAVIALPGEGPEREVVEHFSSGTVRLLTAREREVEVSHEALIRHWTRLRDKWLNRNREILRVRNRIRSSKTTWEQSGRLRGRLLPSGLPMVEARNLLKNHGDVLIDDIVDYIKRSCRRQGWRRFWIWSGLTVGAFVAMAAGFLGFVLVLFAFGRSESDEIQRLEKYQREIYERESKMPDPPPPLENPQASTRPFRSFKNRVGIEMVWCWPGTFMMGSAENEPLRNSNETLHEVTLTRGFWMARTEVTQGQWNALMARNRSFHPLSHNHPVVWVSWIDAKNYCAHLTEVEWSTSTIPGDWEYTLPTEAQWEYACRAGSSAPFSGEHLRETGWYLANSYINTRAVGRKRANRWGFYDMHGNVYEWCRDWYGDYKPKTTINPIGPESGMFRVMRGGCWYATAWFCRSAARDKYGPNYGSHSVGFRPVLVPSVSD